MEKEKCLNAIRDYRAHTASFDETVQALNSIFSNEEKMQQRHQSLCWELEVISMMEEETENVSEINKVFSDIIENIENYEPCSILTLIPRDSCVTIFSDPEAGNGTRNSHSNFTADKSLTLPVGDSEYISFAIFLDKKIMLNEMMETQTPVLDKIDFLPLSDMLYVEDCASTYGVPYISEELFIRLTVFSNGNDVYSLLVNES